MVYKVISYIFFIYHLYCNPIKLRAPYLYIKLCTLQYD